MAEPNIIKFDGNTGAGDTINMSVALPSSHSGNRIIELVGIATSVWTPAAYEAGTDWESELGITPNKTGGFTLDMDKYVNLFSEKLVSQKSITKISPAAATLNKAEINASVSDVKKNVKSNPANFKRTNTIPVVITAESPTLKAKVNPAAAISTNAQAPTNIKKSDSQLSLESALSDTIQMSLMEVDRGIVQVPVGTWSGNTVLTTVDVNEPVVPKFFIIQVLGISSFLGDYGLGKTVKTFSLLPGEETKISMKTGEVRKKVFLNQVR